MDKASSGELSFSEVSTWSMPELFTGRAKDGRRIINQQAKQALIARLRVSPGSMV
jgi:hypothetical protein